MQQALEQPEEVVLVDDTDNVIGTALKSEVHTAHTPLHRAFSTYIFNRQGELLVQQRNRDKKTWPGVWSNSCCGHPAPGETREAAVKQRVQHELGITLDEVTLVLPQFRYRVELDGVVENEICPVFVAVTDQAVTPDPAEVAALEWLSWADFVAEIRDPATRFSPWAVLQVAELVLTDEVLRLQVDAALRQLLPEHWEPQQLEELIGPATYDRDTAALTAQLSRPSSRFVMSGGKRVRPRLFMTVLYALGYEHPEQFFALAAALEVAHNATLVIDDIQDGSKLRRGEPTMHEAHGLDVAVNAGTFMHLVPLVPLVALEQASQLEPTQRLALLHSYTQELMAVYAGQTLDVSWHQQPDKPVTQEQYLEMCRLKTGGLMRLAMRLACIIAEADATTTGALLQFAEAAGVAFQIRDDVLDITADSAEFGKAYGNDITEGKHSLPVVLALRQLPGAKASRLRALLAAHSRDQETIAEAVTLITGTTAIDDALGAAEEMLAAATTAVDQALPASAGKEKLLALAASFVTRQS